jgi:hypothetical protein
MWNYCEILLVVRVKKLRTKILLIYSLVLFYKIVCQYCYNQTRFVNPRFNHVNHQNNSCKYISGSVPEFVIRIDWRLQVCDLPIVEFLMAPWISSDGDEGRILFWCAVFTLYLQLGTIILINNLRVIS